MNRENVGERMFERYLRDHRYEFEVIPRGCGATADYRVATAGGDVYCEVEGIVATEQERQFVSDMRVWVGEFRRNTLDGAVRDAAHQLEPYAGHPCVVILHSAAPTVFLDWLDVCEAMFGRLCWHFRVHGARGADWEKDYLGMLPSGHGRIVHPRHPNPT
jgi:hypothetical protein